MTMTAMQVQDTLPFLRPREDTRREGAWVMDVDGLTDRGCVRDTNEDQFLIADFNRQLVVVKTGIPGVQPRALEGTQAKLMIVADGMGGHGGGDLASSVAVDVIVYYMTCVMPWFWHEDEARSREVLAHLGPALLQCQDRLEAVAARKGIAHQQPGTTLTAAYVLDDTLYLLHAGDSRCYLYRSGELHQVTHDHTLASKLAQLEGVPPEQVKLAGHLHHVLVNAVGGNNTRPEPEVRRLPLEQGDTLLLCTDGLTRHVSDERIAAHLGGGLRAPETCRRLIDDANSAGGRDNITAVVCRIGAQAV